MKKLIKNISLWTILLFMLIVNSTFATEKDSIPKSNQTLVIGLRIQKAAGYYWSNGITAEYSFNKLWKQKISLGFNFISSRLGSAFMSNAIPFYEVDVSGIKYFRRSKCFKPLVRLNIGYSHANYGSEIYKNIPNQSVLLSIETGAAYDFKFPLRLALSGGYNIITGNGTKGMGTIFPIYVQFSLFYRFDFKERKNK